MKAKVVTDSGSGLSLEEAKKAGIELLTLQLTTSQGQYQDGVDLDAQAVLKLLAQGEMPTTSQPSPAVTEELLERLEQEGVSDIIAVNLSGALSSTNAQLQAFARNHNIQVHNVEPYSTLYVQQYLALEAKRLLDAGMDPQKAASLLQKAADASKTYVVVEDLKHLAKGGRLGPTAARLGSLLKIKPVLELSKQTGGTVELNEKVRTFSRAAQKMIEKLEAEAANGEDYLIYLGDGQNENFEKIEEEARKTLPYSFRKGMISPILLCHTGPGAVGMQLIAKIKED